MGREGKESYIQLIGSTGNHAGVSGRKRGWNAGILVTCLVLQVEWGKRNSQEESSLTDEGQSLSSLLCFLGADASVSPVEGWQGPHQEKEEKP